jgi:hypothetical protein
MLLKFSQKYKINITNTVWNLKFVLNRNVLMIQHENATMRFANLDMKFLYMNKHSLYSKNCILFM